MQDDAAHHLDVEHPLLRLAPARLADGGERLEEQLVERLAVLEPLPELGRLRAQLVVRELLEVGLERRDVRGLLLQALEAAAFADAKDLLEAAADLCRHAASVPTGAWRLIESLPSCSSIRHRRHVAS